MPPKYNKDAGRTATMMLATAYVMLTGLGACLIIVLAAADRTTAVRLGGIAVAAAFGLWFLFWLLRDKRTNHVSLTNIAWLGRKQPRAEEVDYKPRKRRRRRSQEYTGTNQPPTVERIRELSDNVKTWVPSRSRSEKHRREHEEG